MESFKVIGDLYNSFFLVQISNPDIMVDYQVWNHLKAILPADYKLPDMNILSVLNQYQGK
jgi:hypothetical protein